MKPLAAHGTTARAKGRPTAGIKGCSCPPCRAAENRYDKRRRYLNATGRTLMVDAAPTAEHLRTLFTAGAGWVQLAAAASSSTSTIQSILTGKVTRIRRTTANNFLALQPGDAIPARRAIPAIGAIRRIRALTALGHRCKDISAATGVEHSTISNLINGHVTETTKEIAERIVAGYRQLANTPGTNARARNRAAREGWPGPLAWDDDIDDPAAQPEVDTGPTAQVTQSRRAADTAEEVRWLAGGGTNPNEIAKRVGRSTSYVRQILADGRGPGWRNTLRRAA